MIKKLLFFTSILMCAVSASAAPAKNIVAYAGESTGPAFAYNKLGEKRKLEKNTPIFEGETLITGKGASSSAVFKDGTTVALNPSTQFRVEEYKFNPEKKGSSAVFRMLKGGFRFISGLVNKNGGDLTFKTPTATIGVRGSSGEITDQKISVFSGKFKVRSIKSGKSVNLGAGQVVGTSSKGITKQPGLNKAKIQQQITQLTQTRDRVVQNLPRAKAFFGANSRMIQLQERTIQVLNDAIARKQEQLTQVNDVPPGGTATCVASPSVPLSQCPQ